MVTTSLAFALLTVAAVIVASLASTPVGRARAASDGAAGARGKQDAGGPRKPLRGRKAHEALVRAVPEAIDLAAAGAAAGLNVALVVELLANRAPPPVRASVAACRAEAAGGVRLADAVHTHLAAGPAPLWPLARALLASERDGVALGPALDAAASAARAERRVVQERLARRLPVLVLFPLVLCVLPAFALVAIAPLLLASLSSIHLGS